MKLYYKKVNTCGDCPNLSDGSMSNCNYNKKEPRNICFFLNKDLTIPEWCPLIEYEERIEVNETKRVWVKINGK